jgi:hypothetical protein
MWTRIDSEHNTIARNKYKNNIGDKTYDMTVNAVNKKDDNSKGRETVPN